MGEGGGGVRGGKATMAAMNTKAEIDNLKMIKSLSFHSCGTLFNFDFLRPNSESL
jgi:hypothetical protein